MTKFEEVAKDIAIKRGYDSFHGLIADQEEANEIIEEFKNWHSDEEFQRLLEQNAELTQENNIVNQIDSQLAKENEDLKSQLQQQALPVVKDFVAEWYEENKKDLDFAIFDFCVELDELDKTSTKFEDWFDSISEKPIETLIRMKNGYTIEKPQLFYLKHIDMSKVDETHDWFILHNGSLGHSPFLKGELPYYCNTAKFTQQDIESMETGSYEQIEVKE